MPRSTLQQITEKLGGARYSPINSNDASDSSSEPLRASNDLGMSKEQKSIRHRLLGIWDVLRLPALLLAYAALCSSLTYVMLHGDSSTKAGNACPEAYQPLMKTPIPQS